MATLTKLLYGQNVQTLFQFLAWANDFHVFYKLKCVDILMNQIFWFWGFWHFALIWWKNWSLGFILYIFSKFLILNVRVSGDEACLGLIGCWPSFCWRLGETQEMNEWVVHGSVCWPSLVATVPHWSESQLTSVTLSLSSNNMQDATMQN